MKLPTARQLSVLSAVAEFIATNGYPPTVRAITEIIGCTSTSALLNTNGYGHLQCLQMKGCLELHAETARGVRITPLGYYLLGLPALRPIAPRKATGPVTGTVDIGQRCRRCEAQLFGGIHLCRQHREAA